MEEIKYLTGLYYDRNTKKVLEEYIEFMKIGNMNKAGFDFYTELDVVPIKAHIEGNLIKKAYNNYSGNIEELIAENIEIS